MEVSRRETHESRITYTFTEDEVESILREKVLERFKTKVGALPKDFKVETEIVCNSDCFEGANVFITHNTEMHYDSEVIK